MRTFGEPNITAEEIDAYLARKASPLTGLGTVFVATGREHNVDPRLIVAIAGAETSFGTSTCRGIPVATTKNAWNWFWCGATRPPSCGDKPCSNSSFPSWADGIQTLSTFIGQWITKGRDTIANIEAKYCASGCENWIRNVTRFYHDELGGDLTDLRFAGGSELSWARTYGGGRGEGAGDVRQSPDGGFLAAGWTKSFRGQQWSDMWLIKLDASGNPSWQQLYGGSEREEISKLVPTSDGGYVAIGLSGSFGASQHAPLVLKFDPARNIEWQKTYLSSGRDWGNDIKQTSDGGYIIAGQTDPCACGGTTRAIVLKLRANGELDWKKIYTGQSTFGSMLQTSDGGYIIAGSTESFGAGRGDALIMKLDGSGNIQWQKAYGGTGSDGASLIQLTSDGGYIVCGGTSSSGAGSGDAWLIKLDSTGNPTWQKTYGGSGDDGAAHVEQTRDGGYVVSGATTSFALTGSDLWVFKVDSAGNLVWQRSYDSGSPSDNAVAVHQTSDGGFIVAGASDPGCPLCNPAPTPQFFTVLKLMPDGSIAGTCPFGVGRMTTAIARDTSVIPRNITLVSDVFAISAIDTSVTTTETTATARLICTPPLAFLPTIEDPAIPRFKTIGQQANGNCGMQFHALTGEIYTVQASTNLTNWVTLGAASETADGFYEFVDAFASQFCCRFYRVVQH
jgi:hypothetical protein